jgi:SagB-type dehydrogenase family enzyme
VGPARTLGLAADFAAPIRMKLLRATSLDRVVFGEFRTRIVAAEQAALVHEPRCYAGYPETPLEQVSARAFTSLDRALTKRRVERQLDSVQPSRRCLSRLLRFAHGVCESEGRGPVPSSGKLQALELFVAPFSASSWLEHGMYHYDRAGHHLARVAGGRDRSDWARSIPSLGQFDAGALLWILVSDTTRLTDKYGERGARFALLEAGHLMQNLCLLSTSLELCTIPLGGFFENEIASSLRLARTDAVLYLGCCG